MKRLVCGAVFALLVGMTAWAQEAQNEENPGSLFPQNYSSPILDRTAHRVGDLVTIVISESSAANFAANLKATKDDSTSVGKIDIPIIGGLFKALGINSSSSNSGSGTTNRTGSLSARMAARVVEVLPNGDLVIEGEKSLRVNKETQTFKLSGIVRRDDVRTDNTVLSENMADSKIEMDGKGVIADRQRRGILTRLIDWIF